MKINEIIKLKRKELDLTQEQMAEYLGVQPLRLINGKKVTLIQIL